MRSGCHLDEELSALVGDDRRLTVQRIANQKWERMEGVRSRGGRAGRRSEPMQDAGL